MRARPFAFSSDGLRLAGEVVVPDEPRARLILAHGIPSGTPPDPTDGGYPALAREMSARGYTAVWFSFRGCRDAPGDFTVAGWRRDLEAAADALSAVEARGPLVLVGSSAGGAAAIAAAAVRADVAAVATLAAPARVGEAASDPELFVQRVRNAGLIRDPAFPPDLAAWIEEFAAEAAEARVAALAPRPLLLIHGDADPVVPYEHAERLFSLASEPKELVRIPGGGHQLRRDPRALDALSDWLEATVPVPASG